MKPTRDIYFGEPKEKPKEKQAEEVVIPSGITTPPVTVSTQKTPIIPISVGGMIAVIGPEAEQLVKSELEGLIEPWQYWGYCKHEQGYMVLSDIIDIFQEYMTEKNTIRKFIMERFQKMTQGRYYQPGIDHIMAYKSVHDDFAVDIHKRCMAYVSCSRQTFRSRGVADCSFRITQLLNKYWIAIPRIVKNDNIQYPSFFTVIEIPPGYFNLPTIQDLRAVFNDMNPHWTLILICNQTFDVNISHIKTFIDEPYRSPDIFYKTFFDDRVYYTPEALK